MAQVPLERLTPNHRHKREQLINAALVVMTRDGRRACTSRAIARECGLGNGLIHYYFENIDELLDAAAEKMGRELVATIVAAAEEVPDTAGRFWAVVEAYLTSFDSPQGRMVVWMDYWVGAMQSGRGTSLSQLDGAVVAVLTEVLAEAGISNAADRARAVSAYVVGSALRHAAGDEPPTDLRAEIAALLGEPLA